MLKLAKIQANPKQRPEDKFQLFEKYLRFIHIIIQK